MELGRHFIYALFDSFDRGIPKYVGQTNRPVHRFRSHTRHSKFTKTRKSTWILDVQERGGYIEVSLLKFCKSKDEANQFEKEYIGLYRSKGYPLTNSTDGGSGFTGYIRTEEHKRKLAEALRGTARHTTPHTVLSRQKISSSKKGVPQTPESVQKRADAIRGQKRTLEQRENMKKAWFLRKQKNGHRI